VRFPSALLARLAGGGGGRVCKGEKEKHDSRLLWYIAGKEKKRGLRSSYYGQKSASIVQTGKKKGPVTSPRGKRESELRRGGEKILPSGGGVRPHQRKGAVPSPFVKREKGGNITTKEGKNHQVKGKRRKRRRYLSKEGKGNIGFTKRRKKHFGGNGGFLGWVFGLGGWGGWRWGGPPLIWGGTVLNCFFSRFPVKRLEAFLGIEKTFILHVMRGGWSFRVTLGGLLEKGGQNCWPRKRDRSIPKASPSFQGKKMTARVLKS